MRQVKETNTGVEERKMEDRTDGHTRQKET